MRTLSCVILLGILALTSCNGGSSKSGANANSNATSNANNQASFNPLAPIKPVAAADPAFKSCNPYYPLVPGSTVKYTLLYSSGVIAEATVVVDAAEEDGQKVFVETTQTIDSTGGVHKAEHTVRKYVCDGEKVRQIYQKTDNRVEGKLTTTDFSFKGEAYLMIEPKEILRKGTRWSYNFVQTMKLETQPAFTGDPVSISFVAQGEEERTVPAGKFKTVKIERNVLKNIIYDYFAPGIGLVERVAAEGTKWQLKEYSGLRPQE
jgi:hypothetical protein